MYDKKPYGFVILFIYTVRWRDSKTPDAEWEEARTQRQMYFNHKLYKTYEVAAEAVEHIKKAGIFRDPIFEIKPLYE